MELNENRKKKQEGVAKSDFGSWTSREESTL